MKFGSRRQTRFSYLQVPTPTAIASASNTIMSCMKAAAECAASHMHALPHVNRLTQVALPQRPARKRAVQAKVQTERGNFSSDQAQRALQYQLERSASPQLPEAKQLQQPPEGYEQDLKRRQTKAREWITPWLVSAAQIFRQSCFCVATSYPLLLVADNKS